MGQIVFRGWSNDVLAGNVTTSADMRIILVMTNTTCDTEHDAQTMSAFTTIDECDGAGYAELDLVSWAGGYDAVNNRYEFDATDGDMDGGGGSIGTSSRQIQGYVLYRYVDGTDANDVPWGYRDIGPYTTAGGTFDFTWNAEGIAQLTGN